MKLSRDVELQRCLKRANVLAVRQGGRAYAKLLDFGLARLTSADPGATTTWSAR